jgi:nucleoside-diphosphate-sugar epimerase
MKRIVITGATGMIGTALTRCALEKNMEILCIVRKETNRVNNIPQSRKIRIAYADLQDYAHIDTAEKYDVLFHLAWDKTAAVSRDDEETLAFVHGTGVFRQ